MHALEAANSSQVLPVGQGRSKLLLKSRPPNIILPDLGGKLSPARLVAHHVNHKMPDLRHHFGLVGISFRVALAFRFPSPER